MDHWFPNHTKYRVVKGGVRGSGFLPTPAVDWFSWACGEGRASMQGCDHFHRAPLSPSGKFHSPPAPSPCRRSPEAETSPITPDPNAWVTPAPSPVGEGWSGEGRRRCIQTGCPIPNELCHNPGSYPHVTHLTRSTAKPMFSVQPQPHTTEWTWS